MQTFFAKPDIQKESLYIGVSALLLFTIGLWEQPFVDFDSRFALFAQEMWRHGPSLFPTTYGAPYPDYPAASTLFIWIVSLPFGAVTKLSAVLPTALAAALNLAITYRLLAQYSRWWALSAVCFELLTVSFLTAARAISLDQMVSTITLLSFYLAFNATQQKNQARLINMGLLLILGFAIRGPLGIVIPAAVVGSYYFLSRQWKLLFQFGLTSITTLVICWFALLGLAMHIYGKDFTHEVIRMQVSGRMDLHDSLARSYYFTSSFGNYVLSYPVAVLVIVLMMVSLSQRLRKPLGNDHESLIIYLVGWVLVVMIGLSIPATKKIRYLLPIVPAIAALAAYPFFDGADKTKQYVWMAFRKILQLLLLVLPGLSLIALWKVFQYIQHHSITVQLPLALTASLLIIIQTGVIWLQWRTTQNTKIAALLAGSVFSVWILNLLIVEPAMLQLHDTRKFVQKVEVLRQQQPGEIRFFRVGKDAAAIEYLANLDYDLQTAFLNNSADIDALPPAPVYIILEDKELSEAKKSTRLQSQTPVLHDRFDNNPYTVFYLN